MGPTARGYADVNGRGWSGLGDGIALPCKSLCPAAYHGDRPVIFSDPNVMLDERSENVHDEKTTFDSTLQRANMQITDLIALVLKNKSVTDLWTSKPDDTVFNAIKKMSEKNVGALPVVDGLGSLDGIVSERDYTRKVILKNKSSKDTLVKEIMTRDLVTITADDSVEKGLQLMTKNRVHHLPVLEGNKIIGIVTIGDLVKWTVSAQEAMIDQLEGYITGTYPG